MVVPSRPPGDIAVIVIVPERRNCGWALSQSHFAGDASHIAQCEESALRRA
jgi:hypothetical protein